MVGEKQVEFQSGGATLPGMLTLPTGEVESAWVFCSPLFEERKASARAMTEAARIFADAGAAVLRFDYRGCGDAPGAFSSFTVADWVADSRAASAFLASHVSTQKTGMLGLRFGAMVAGMASAQGPGSLVLWAPVVKGDAYVTGEVRRKLVREMVTFGKSQGDRASVSDRIEAAESVDLDGYEITPRLYRDVCETDMKAMVAAWPDTVLAVEVSHQERLSSEFRDCYSGLSGGQRHAMAVRLQPFWNLVGYVDCGPLARATLEWLHREAFARKKGE